MIQLPTLIKRWLRLLHRRRDNIEAAEVSVRELAFVILLATVVIGSAFMIAYHFVRPAPPDHFVISTGNETGAYHLFGQRYRDLLAQEKIEVELSPSTGSVENLSRLDDPESGVDVALIQGGIASAEQEHPVRSLGAIYYEPLWVFYRGTAELTRLTQLAGKRIAAGPEGSGTRVLAVNMLKASGATGRNLIMSPLAGKAAADALIAGQIDAALFVAASDAPIVQQLLKADDIRLMSLAHAEALAQRFSYLSPVTLLRGTVDIASDIPPRNVNMVAVTAHLVARADFHPALVSVLLQAATKVHNGAGVFHKAGEFPAARGGDFPISEDAARYYKSGPPFLQRYMPFWVANLIERLLVLLVPLIAVLIPMMRIMPALYDWRVKRKIFRWYRELKEVEVSLHDAAGTADTAALLKRLDEIEVGVAEIRVPLTYWDYVYTLRGHIDLVRARLIGTQAAPVAPLKPPPDR
ncbi:MAG: TAXI family TRAP transporter solute-binding subunit [Betaproteobacteria bacterium]|nr:MAG: TAXI family TRAP transporter solute-binding subunit [Betaproteobacteria bacterium]